MVSRPVPNGKKPGSTFITSPTRSGPVWRWLASPRKKTPETVAPVTSVSSAASCRFSIRNSDMADRVSTFDRLRSRPEQRAFDHIEQRRQGDRLDTVFHIATKASLYDARFPTAFILFEMRSSADTRDLAQAAAEIQAVDCRCATRGVVEQAPHRRPFSEAAHPFRN